MALKLDFLTQEILVKIATKIFGILRTLYLLYIFGISSYLDEFYYSNSVIGLIVLINILFETTYSKHIKVYKNNLSFHKNFLKSLNILVLVLTTIVLIFSFLFIKDENILIHICILAVWSLININSYYFLLVYRYSLKNKLILNYYFWISFINIFTLILIIYADLISSTYLFIIISGSILFSELVTFTIIFGNYFIKVIKSKFARTEKIKWSEMKIIFKVLIILILVSLIDVTDKTFLSFFDEGAITYYTYGFYAPLIIRQALDVKSNFFAQINLLRSPKEINKIFFSTVKKLLLFFILASILLIFIVEFFEPQILGLKLFTSEDFSIIKSILFIGLVITPFYMIWDLFYRFYYRKNIIDVLLKVTIVGFILNILMNYIFSMLMNYEIYGILYSTLLIFVFYNIISYFIFFVKTTP